MCVFVYRVVFYVLYILLLDICKFVCFFGIEWRNIKMIKWKLFVVGYINFFLFVCMLIFYGGFSKFIMLIIY